MEMVIHEDVGVKLPPKNIRRFAQQFVKMPAVSSFAINRAPFVATGGDMIPGSWPFDAYGSCHVCILSFSTLFVNRIVECLDVTPTAQPQLLTQSNATCLLRMRYDLKSLLSGY